MSASAFAFAEASSIHLASVSQHNVTVSLPQNYIDDFASQSSLYCMILKSCVFPHRLHFC